MDGFLQSKAFRIVLILILIALFVFAVGIQIGPFLQAKPGAAAALEPSQAEQSAPKATPAIVLPAEIRDQPSLIRDF